MAQSTVNPYGITRGGVDIFNTPAGGEIEQNYNNRGDLLVAQALPQKAELIRMGATWTCRIATASAFTYVAAWPTTRAELVLYNGESQGGKSYVIQSAWLYGVTSMAAAQPMTLIAQNVPVVATVPTDDTAQLINSRSGRGNYTGKAKRALANTAAGQIANLWDVLTTSLVPSPTTNLGAAIFADLMGAYIVPPGGVFALNAVAGTAAGTAIIGVTWSEVQLTLG
jgi:hypothetical protein